jgi:hypothetical protein
VCQGAGLVEDQSADTREPFERLSSLDQNAVLGRAGETSDKRNGDGENQRTRRRNHKYSNSADWVGSDHPCRSRHSNGHPKEDDRVTVRKARHWCTRSLRRFDQANDTCIGAFRSKTRRLKIEYVSSIC